jgi:AraC family transcriptional activator of pyochelin receptor
MSLNFTSIKQNSNSNNSSVRQSDLDAEGLIQCTDTILIDNANVTFKNWLFDGYRLGSFVLNQKIRTNYTIQNDIDTVKIYFNRAGTHHANYKHLSKRFMLAKGQCNMIYSDVLDTNISQLDNYSEIFTLQFTRQCYFDMLKQCGLSFDFFSRKVDKNQVALFSPQWLSISPMIDKCIRDILDCPFGSGMKKNYLHAKATELFILFANPMVEKNTPSFCIKNSADREKLYFAKQYIEQNYADPNSLAELSKKSGLNEFKLKQGFKILFNTSVIDYLISYRLEQAYNILLSGQKNVSEVCYLSGYNSPSYFGKAFKKKYGINPKDV